MTTESFAPTLQSLAIKMTLKLDEHGVKLIPEDPQRPRGQLRLRSACGHHCLRLRTHAQARRPAQRLAPGVHQVRHVRLLRQSGYGDRVHEVAGQQLILGDLFHTGGPVGQEAA